MHIPAPSHAHPCTQLLIYGRATGRDTGEARRDTSRDTSGAAALDTGRDTGRGGVGGHGPPRMSRAQLGTYVTHDKNTKHEVLVGRIHD